LGNPEEVYKFLETYNLPRLNNEIENLSSPIMSKEIELLIKILLENFRARWLCG
jgi:hypothetical protein